MRRDEQMIFIAGTPPIRCGRAIYFRRPEMLGVTGENRFKAGRERGEVGSVDMEQPDVARSTPEESAALSQQELSLF